MDDFHEVFHYLVVVMISIARMTGILLIVPFLSARIVGGTVRKIVIISLSFMVIPVVQAAAPSDFTAVSIFYVFAVLFKEVLLGLFMGFVAGIVFWVAEGVGFLVDSERGTTMASIFNPLIGHSTSPQGSFLSQAITILFFTVGGFMGMLSVIYESYLVWPVFSFFPQFDSRFPLFILGVADQVTRLTILFAAPILIVLFISELGLGFMNRFVPQLNVFFLSMPMKSGLATFLFIPYMSFLVVYFKDQFLQLKGLIHMLETILK